jgi:hypothetical protein
MKRRLVDDNDGPNSPESRASRRSAAGSVEKHPLPSGLFLYRYALGSCPPDVEEHRQVCSFLGALISKLMIATGKRLEPFVCMDGRHLSDDFFSGLRESGTAWRALLGFPLIPGFHPFQYLPIAYHVPDRDGWNQAADHLMGTGGMTLYLTSLPPDDFFTRLIQLLLVRDERGATDVFPVYLPETVLDRLQNASRPELKPMLDCFQFFIGENPTAGSIDIVTTIEIESLVNTALESSARATQ